MNDDRRLIDEIVQFVPRRNRETVAVDDDQKHATEKSRGRGSTSDRAAAGHDGIRLYVGGGHVVNPFRLSINPDTSEKPSGLRDIVNRISVPSLDVDRGDGGIVAKQFRPMGCRMIRNGESADVAVRAFDFYDLHGEPLSIDDTTRIHHGAAVCNPKMIDYFTICDTFFHVWGCDFCGHGVW